MPLVKYINCFNQYRKKLILEEDSDEEEQWDFQSFQVGELLSVPIPADWKQEGKGDAVVTMDNHIVHEHSEVQTNTSVHKADKIICSPVLQKITPETTDNVPSVKGKVSQLPVGKRIGMHLSSDVKLNKKETAETSRGIFKKSFIAIRLKKPMKTESLLVESQDKNKNLSKNFTNVKNATKDQLEVTASIVETVEHLTDPKNDIEKSTDDYTISSCADIDTNKTCSSSKNSLATKNNFPGNSRTSSICNSPKRCSSSKKPPSKSGQNSKSIKPKTALGLLRRSKSKLGDRAIARRKSFLKKGDGLMSKSKFSKQKLEAKGSPCSREDKPESVKRTVDHGASSSTKSKPSLLCLTRKKDAGNSTFVMREFTAGKKCGKKVLTKDSSSKTEVIKAGKRFPGETSKKGKTVGTFSRTRKQWNDTGVKSFEGMIFSSIFAFSDELRESSENIYAKLQTLYDSVEKPKSSPIFERSNAFSREWRENNEDILNNGNQEIAGIFRNLRKVESNVKTIDQAITSLLKIHFKESLNNSN